MIHSQQSPPPSSAADRASERRFLTRIAGRAVRFGWFSLLLLTAFGVLAAGLSDRSTPKKKVPTDNAEPITKVPESRPNASVHSPANPARVEQSLRQTWVSSEMQPAPIADWITICRRMSLSLVGTGLSLEEIRHLESLPAVKRESAHLEALLNDGRFHHYWAERWTRFLVGADEGPFVVYRRRRFRNWFEEQLAENRRYDQIVRSLVTAEGLWTDQPEVNFLTVTFDSNDGQPDPIRLAARTSRAFLGLRIDCLQCHDDFLGNVNLGDVQSPRAGLQSDFHQLAAFYSSAKTNGLKGVVETKPDYRYQYLDADEEVDVEPMVPYAPELLPEKGKSRHRLADWITHPENRQAARCAVSHVWALLFGRSASAAVDDLPLDEPVPEVIETLTDEFLRSNFNLRHLIRLIVHSSAFRVSSKAEFEISEDHEESYAVFPLTRLRPEQVAGSIIQSARIKKIDRDSSFLVQLQKFGSINDFVQRYGDMGEDEFTDESVTITQRLVMLNGKMLKESIDNNPILNASTHIEMFAPSNALAIETTYLCVLNRYPSQTERDHFEARFEQTESRRDAVEDLFWVLLNSTEFAWNH